MNSTKEKCGHSVQARFHGMSPLTKEDIRDICNISIEDASTAKLRRIGEAASMLLDVIDIVPDGEPSQPNVAIRVKQAIDAAFNANDEVMRARGRSEADAEACCLREELDSIKSITLSLIKAIDVACEEADELRDTPAFENLRIKKLDAQKALK